MAGANFAAVALLAFCGPAFAQSADRPDVRVGDRWLFSAQSASASAASSRAWEITAVTAAGIEGSEDGLPLRLTLELNVLDSPRTRESNPRWLSFPLSVGKRWRYDSHWEFKAKGSRGRLSGRVEVVSFEKIAVPAGTFDAFRITAREALSGRSPIGTDYAGEVTRTYWYAPAARAVVKSLSHNPYLGSTTVELVSYELRR